MAIKRSSANPVIILDVVVSSVENDNFVNRSGKVVQRRGQSVGPGEVVYEGRRLGVQTGAGPASELLEVRVPIAFDGISFDGGDHILINAEYSEYKFEDDSGRQVIGSTVRFHSFVNPGQFDGWKGLVATQVREKQPA